MPRFKTYFSQGPDHETLTVIQLHTHISLVLIKLTSHGMLLFEVGCDQ